MIEQRDDLIRKETSTLTEHITSIRDRRRTIEDGWLINRKVTQSQTRLNFATTDESLISTPYVRKAVERTIVRAVKLLMPNVKWHEVAAIGDVPDSKLSNMDSFLTYVLRKKIKSKTNISQLVRSMIFYNRCHLKTSVCVRNGQVWPTQRAVDPFSFYMYPETAVSVEEADFVFEDFMISYETYQGYVQTGRVKEIKLKQLTAPNWPYHLQERLAHQGLTEDKQEGIPTSEPGERQRATPFVSLTEVWLYREDRLFQAYIVWNLFRGPQIVSFFPSYYDEPMYKSAVHRSLPNEAYNASMLDDVAPLDRVANMLFNYFIEAVKRERGIYGVDIGDTSRTEQYRAEGGALWKFNGDPREAMNFIAPPTTSTNILRAWQLVTGLINSMGATGTIAEGQPGRNMPRAGGAVQDLVSLAMADTADISALIEQEVLTPSLGDIYKVCLQFMPDEQLIRIPGGKSVGMKKADFAADYDFEWVGSLQFQDEQVRAQRMMIFLNMLPQLAPMLQQMGYGFNIVELIQNIWRYSLGERSLQKVVAPLQQLMKDMKEDEVQRMIDDALSQSNGTSSGANGSSNSGGAVSGMKYSLPSVTSGFVNQV